MDRAELETVREELSAYLTESRARLSSDRGDDGPLVRTSTPLSAALTDHPLLPLGALSCELRHDSECNDARGCAGRGLWLER
jgi:hypothetical protein